MTDTKDQETPATEEVPTYDNTLELTAVESQYIRLAREEHNRLKAEAKELADRHNQLIAAANQALAAAVENSISGHKIDLTPGSQVSIINDKDCVPAALVWNDTDTPESQAAEDHATTGKAKKKAKRKSVNRRGRK